MNGFQFKNATPFMLVSAIRWGGTLRPTQQTAYRHAVWTIDYPLTSGSDCRVDGTDWEPRDAFVAHLYPPEFNYYERNKNDIPNFQSLWLQFSGEFPELQKKICNPAGFAAICDHKRILRDLLREVIRCSDEGQRGYWRATAGFCQILDKLKSIVQTGEKPWVFSLGEHESFEALHIQVENYLQKHFREKIRIQEIAIAHGLSVSSLSHRYRQETGETILETLVKLRLELSLPMLQRGLRLKEIAESVGLGNEFYYSRRFRGLYGLSPLRWRERTMTAETRFRAGK